MLQQRPGEREPGDPLLHLGQPAVQQLPPLLPVGRGEQLAQLGQAEPASLPSWISATRVTCTGPYTRRPATRRAGASSPASSQCRSTCVASPKRPANSPIEYSIADLPSP
jgi:hypothetical protein